MTSSSPSPPPSAQATAATAATAARQPGRVRYRVVAFAVALAGVTYLDRICISVLAPSMMRDLSLTRMEMSYVFSAFAIAYAAFEIPSAWWGERVGTRRVLTRIVCWWSAFTMATGLVTSYTALLAVRFLFGAGEAGAWPNAARTFSRWIPVSERGRVQGVFFAGAFLAGGLTPALVSFLEPRVGWRGVFLGCGAIGLVWAALWYRWFRDEPSEHPQVGAEELAVIVDGRGDHGHHHASASILRKFVGNPSAWALCLGYFSNSYGSYFVMTWLPTYLAEARGFEPGALALFAGLPMLLGVGSNLIGGVTTDLLCAKFGLRAGRAAIGVVSYVVAAGTMLLAAIEQDPRRAAILLAVASASSMFALAAHWAAAIDIGRENSGVLSAGMNTTGQIGSIASPIVAAYMVDHYANWALPLYVMAALYLFSAFTWFFVKPPRVGGQGGGRS
jgi:ACS family glucarate transporter-like MFS transporter